MSSVPQSGNNADPVDLGTPQVGIPLTHWEGSHPRDAAIRPGVPRIRWEGTSARSTVAENGNNRLVTGSENPGPTAHLPDQFTLLTRVTGGWEPTFSPTAALARPPDAGENHYGMHRYFSDFSESPGRAIAQAPTHQVDEIFTQVAPSENWWAPEIYSGTQVPPQALLIGPAVAPITWESIIAPTAQVPEQFSQNFSTQAGAIPSHWEGEIVSDTQRVQRSNLGAWSPFCTRISTQKPPSQFQ